MPSRVEPCGLNQMYSLRYGTIPIVNEIGGLKDTVIDIKDGGFGFCHNGVTLEKTTDAITRATAFYQKTNEFLKNSEKIMEIDHSWNNSAQEYVNLYKSLKNKL
jgi:starch synthase